MIENIRVAGKEWRPSAVPEDLKKFHVQSLVVEISGHDFQISWAGAISPFYNPVCFGAVDWSPAGSRIRIGFGLSKRDAARMLPYAFMAIFPLLINPTKVYWGLFGLMFFCLGGWALHNRAHEPMRSRLIDVVNKAARDTPKSVREIWA